MREMENKYNITLFDLLLSLSARVNATIRNRSFDQIRQNHSEFKFLMHVKKLHRKLKHYEENKRLKPHHSQAVERLSYRISELFQEAHMDDSIIEQQEEESPERDHKAQRRTQEISIERDMTSIESSKLSPTNMQTGSISQDHRHKGKGSARKQLLALNDPTSKQTASINRLREANSKSNILSSMDANEAMDLISKSIDNDRHAAV